MVRVVIRFLALLQLLILAAMQAAAATQTTVKAEARASAPRQDLKFSESAPYSSTAAISRHFGYTSAMPEYSVTNETFSLILPTGYSTNTDWGLLVWIGPGNEPRVSPPWEIELARHRLVFVGAYRSGNERHPIDRFRLALDATYNICRRYRIDRQRIYVGGFSGGGRIASMLGVGYADVFRGALCVCGVNFYQSVSDGRGKFWPASYGTEAGVLRLAQTNTRFVLLTGEHDPNRKNTKDLAENGFKTAGFTSVLYLEVPGMGHTFPTVAVLDQALSYLAGNRGRSRQETEAVR